MWWRWAFGWKGWRWKNGTFVIKLLSEFLHQTRTELRLPNEDWKPQIKIILECEEVASSDSWQMPATLPTETSWWFSNVALDWFLMEYLIVVDKVPRVTTVCASDWMNGWMNGWTWTVCIYTRIWVTDTRAGRYQPCPSCCLFVVSIYI